MVWPQGSRRTNSTGNPGPARDRREGTQTEAEAERDKRRGKGKSQTEGRARQTPSRPKETQKEGAKAASSTACGGKSPATLQAQPCPGEREGGSGEMQKWPRPCFPVLPTLSQQPAATRPPTARQLMASYWCRYPNRVHHYYPSGHRGIHTPHPSIHAMACPLRDISLSLVTSRWLAETVSVPMVRRPHLGLAFCAWVAGGVETDRPPPA
ncbi:hypothetical protein EDB80DRAFT_687034 [Ilyonectria destructans]|nr:hypothetical protein EDB80DRAFT_687034 [Ilyonectria destructans]